MGGLEQLRKWTETLEGGDCPGIRELISPQIEASKSWLAEMSEAAQLFWISGWLLEFWVTSGKADNTAELDLGWEITLKRQVGGVHASVLMVLIWPFSAEQLEIITQGLDEVILAYTRIGFEPVAHRIMLVGLVVEDGDEDDVIWSLLSQQPPGREIYGRGELS